MEGFNAKPLVKVDSVLQEIWSTIIKSEVQQIFQEKQYNIKIYNS